MMEKKITEEESETAMKAGFTVCYNSKGEAAKIHTREETAALMEEWDEEMRMPKRLAGLKRKRLNMMGKN